ncbi:Ribonuclease III [Purpureocillium takamizusanense]|uniref:Ribonuclease III n=1 Tax=Purpureocillium takamizusanense TaxID=2060973 RepID=A0A9Q8QIZ4_9HYPO|nr:Ribonuclease III [Purpureocillium takamizusanense]UNI20036.1 Ribonuclease III [Purpureocillium takamizusanense]
MAKRPASSLEAGEVLSQSDQASSKRPRQDGSELTEDDQPRTIQQSSFESMPGLTDFIPWKSSEISSQLPPLPQVKDPELEKRAFTHPGVPRNGEESYERLEWLGDAYIELAATGLIFKTFAKTSAGRCSQLRELLVRNTTLASYFRQYNMASKAILPPEFHGDRGLGRGRSSDKDLCKTQADMFEAYFGAVVASDPQHGKANALAWIRTLWGQTIKEKIVEYEKQHGASAGAAAAASASASAAAPATPNLKPKDKLRAAIGAKGILLSYLDMPGNKKDKNHGLPLYTIGVYLDGWGETKKLLGTGTALQKKEAGHKAAAQALENKKLMKVYEAKKKAFQEAMAATQENDGSAE